MVILLSAVAVVVAAVMLVAWFFVGGGFTLIYGAMALAAASMVLLWVARWLGSTAGPAHPEQPAPLEISAPVRARVPHEPHVHVPSAGSLPSDDETADDRLDEGALVDVTSAFPIKDYDHLWVTQILPLLHDLDPDELAMVEARERGGRHRGGVLDAVEAERAHRGNGHEARGIRPAEPEVDDEDPWTTDGTAWDPDDVDWEAEPPTWSAQPAAEPEPEPSGPVRGEAVDIEPVKVDQVEVAPAGAPRVRTFLGRPAGPITIRRD